MVFAAACLWLLIIVLLAWGVYSLWLGMAKPNAINIILLPGTAAAYVGRVVALLITGATVPEAPKGAPRPPGGPAACPQPKMPVAGPVIVALVPMLLISVILYLLISEFGGPVVAKIPPDQISKDLPLTLTAFWEQMRALVTLCEKTLDAVRGIDASSWQAALFVYLMVCLTVRLAPFPGNLKGHVVAVILVSIAAVLAGTLTPRLEEVIRASWPLLCLTVGWLLLLLLASLLAKAVISSAQTIIRWE